MHMEHVKNNGMSDRFALNSFLSVSKIAIMMGIIAIENLKKRSVVWSIPF